MSIVGNVSLTPTSSKDRNYKYTYNVAVNNSILNLEDIKWHELSIKELRSFKDLSVRKEQKNKDAKPIPRTSTPRLILSSKAVNIIYKRLYKRSCK